MNKFELKHLAPYLPYVLKLWHEKNRSIYPLVVGNNTLSIRGGLRIDEFEDEGCKPILHPISDLIKEIEIGGKMFVPKEEIGLVHDISGNNILNFRTGERINVLTMPYFIVEMLLEWHFDVFGLIDLGLAIDINTLDVNK